MNDVIKFPGVEDDPEDAVYCENCGTIIPPERLEALPETKHCVKCSTVKSYVGFMEPAANKGTASEITIIDAEDEESLRRAQRATSDNELDRR